MMRLFLLVLVLFNLKLKAEEPSSQYKYNLSVLTIFNNDERFLKEWIEYHLLLGVEHFYLYNHRSTDNFQAVLDPYIANGIVELTNWTEIPKDWAHWKNIQKEAYKNCLAKASLETKWLAVIDTDEFIFPVEENTIPEFLKNYEKVGGVVVNWQQYGTSNIWEIPADKLMIETLTWKADPLFEDNYQFKMILKPKHVKYPLSAHSFVFKSPWYAVTPEYIPYPKIQISDYRIESVNIEKIRINHYWTRDGRFFDEEKIARHKKIYKDVERAYRRAAQMNVIEDPCMQKYVEPLRQRMQLP